MDSVVKVRECAWCHEPFHLHDGRYRYCSDECAEKARLARGEGILCGTYETRSERERKKILADYWRRCYAAIDNMRRRRRAI